MPALLPVIAVLAFVAAGAAVVAVSSGASNPQLKKLKAETPLQKVKAEQRLRIVAATTAPAIENVFAMARPVYVKSKGRKTFTVAACMTDWLADLKERCKRDTGEDCESTAVELLQKVLRIYGAGAIEIADWLAARLCLKLRAKLRAYEVDGEPGTWWRVDVMRQGKLTITQWDGTSGDVVTEMVRRLNELSPMDLPPRKGWKRAWVLPEWPTRTRSEHAETLVWSVDEKPGKAIMQEIVPTRELRRMALLLAETGAFTREDFDEIDSGRKHKWSPTIRANAKKWYPGIEKVDA